MITVRLQFLAILLLLGIICSGMLEIQKVDGELRASQATVGQLTTILVKVRHDFIEYGTPKALWEQQQPKHNHQHL
jgi:hypothetical protein